MTSIGGSIYMKEIKMWENSNLGKLRTIEEGGKIFFCRNDVVNALGYCNKAKHDRKLQAVDFIVEEEVFQLIAQSGCTQAERFTNWIVSEVLPSIRKNHPDVFTITQIAKSYGMSGRALNTLLFQKGIQFKQSGQWMLYRKYQNKGYTYTQTYLIQHSDGTSGVVMETKWTVKGKAFLDETLKNMGILSSMINS